MDKNGNTTWLSTEAGQQLQHRLNDERTLESLDHLLARIETLEIAVERLTTIMEQAPGMISMVTDMADEQYKKLSANGVNLEQRLGTALSLAEKLTSPEVEAKIGAMDKLLQFSDQAPGHMAMVVDMADEEMRRAFDSGVDFAEIFNTARKAGVALSEAKYMKEEAPKGIFGLLRALKDPDRQNALGFLLRFAKAFGQKMK